LSSPEPRPVHRSRTRGSLGLLVAAGVVLATGGCAAAGASTTATAPASSAAVPADDLTRRIAEVEVARQCAVATLTFPDESAITTDLDTRLATAGLTHQQWKSWHDALALSPGLVAQVSTLRAAGCAGT